MKFLNEKNDKLTDTIIKAAKSHGAALAGIANVAVLKHSPSHRIYGKMSHHAWVLPRDRNHEKKLGEIEWPEGARSAVVIAIAHEADKPDLDWWDGHQGTKGNRILIKIINTLAQWVEQELNINTHPLPYHVERGGIFLKDAAVMAGLGCIGKNNLLVTPKFGPRVRLRAMLLDAELAPNGPMDFNPCEDCDAPCMQICPRNAFSRVICSPGKMDIADLPVRNGCYSRTLCNIQMEKDIKNADVIKTSDDREPYALIKYCRRCEITCPVGR